MSLLLTIHKAGNGGVSPINPADLSPTNWFDENERANNNWGDKLSAKAFGDGGATSYFPFTQNSLAYFETDAGFTPLFRYDTSGWFTSIETSFSFLIAHKTRVAGNTTDKRYFQQTSDDAQAFWEMRRDGNLKMDYRIVDDLGNIMNAVSSFVVNDDAWKIAIVTVEQEVGAGVVTVYQSNGETITGSNASWVLTRFNGALSGTFLNGGGGKNSSWVGTAELIFFDNKILTLEEANGIGLWVAQKWNIEWIAN